MVISIGYKINHQDRRGGNMAVPENNQKLVEKFNLGRGNS
jgi:hypothetical protein